MDAWGFQLQQQKKIPAQVNNLVWVVLIVHDQQISGVDR